jgi:pyridoxamine 5'-phosphate oxidase
MPSQVEPDTSPDAARDEGLARLPGLEALRREYDDGGFEVADLAPTWHEQFARWFADAGHLDEPNAMVFATADAQGRPSARTVLLKGMDAGGFVLFTNYTSRKAREASANPHASLVFPWYPLRRQVVVVGTVERLTSGENAAYFSSRPRGSQLGAWASRQSSVIDGRTGLVARRDALAARWPGEVPVPDFWGGLRVVPETVEFWAGRRDRLHDRLRFRRTPEGAWVVERLSP